LIWHAQVGNLNEALHQINLRDMLDASMLTGASDIALERVGARADKAGLQQSFNNFLAAHDELMGATILRANEAPGYAQRCSGLPNHRVRTPGRWNLRSTT
jgi:hypothetical protein